MPSKQNVCAPMKQWKLIILLFAIGCTPKISEHFEENRYVQNYGTHIINEPLKLYFRSPGDIDYVTDKTKLRKILRKEPIKFTDSVLVYGKADDPPYEYFVTVSGINKTIYPFPYIVFDTIIEQKNIRFIGRSLKKNNSKSLTIDLKNMLESIEVGDSIRREISTVMDVVKKYENSNKFYQAMREVSEYPAYNKQEEWAKLQMELTFSSFLGGNEFYETRIQKLEENQKLNDSISDIIENNYLADSEVIEKIVEEAKDHQIVMINENHFYPNHRIFVSKLLPELKALGYTYLALEALGNNQDSLLNIKKSYPTLMTGFYTSEQNYSNLIRHAKNLGFQFIAYDSFNENMGRETFQAETIFNKTFKNNPKAKVIVLAGIDHILELPTETGKKWMASIFKEKYNIDPLTISQTHLNKYRKKFKNEYVLIDSKNFDIKRLGSVDFQLLNNTSLSQSLWDSSFEYKNNFNMEVQVLLFYGNEIANSYDYHNKIPYYTTILKKGKVYDLPTPSNQKIYLYVLDQYGNTIDKQIIQANPF